MIGAVSVFILVVEEKINRPDEGPGGLRADSGTGLLNDLTNQKSSCREDLIPIRA